MKALTLRQPWATLVAIGAKKIETRSWRTKYRGPLLIHASKGMSQAEVEFSWCKPVHDALRSVGIDPAKFEFPRGAILAVAVLDDCKEIGPHTPFPPMPERALGNYHHHRFMWTLDMVTPLIEPYPLRGAQGLWSVNESEMVNFMRVARHPPIG